MPAYHSAVPRAIGIGSRQYWVLGSAFLILLLSGMLVLSSPHFGLLNFAVTLLLVIATTLVLYNRPVGTSQRILYFQLIILLILYPVKGLNIFWQLQSGSLENLPFPIRDRLLILDLSNAFQMSCLVCILLAILLHFTPKRHKIEKRLRQLEFHAGALIFLTLSIFCISLLIRLSQVSGLPGAVGYIINHRGTPFAFALLIYLLIENGRQKLATRMFVLWLALGFLMFILFGSKSYIFLPVIFMFAIYLFSGRLILPKYVALLLAISLITLYPMFNFYRSWQLSGAGEANIIELYRLASLNYIVSGGTSWGESFILYLNEALNRFVGIEWFLVILDAKSSNLLPTGTGPIQNLLAVNDTMRYIVGMGDTKIGIAPSFLGSAYLITGGLISSMFLIIILCVAFIWLDQIFCRMFPNLRSVIVAPLCLIIFSIITDGVILSLYWDLPAFALICFAFSAIMKNMNRT